MPDLCIITGSNGAGKSKVGPRYLPQQVKNLYPVFDGDKLYMQKQKELWQSGMRAHKEAKKIANAFVTDTFDSLVENAITSNESFVYEGHFTNDATWDVPKRFKSTGYNIYIIFLGLSDPDHSEARVIERYKRGGHYVDRLSIEDNFYGNLDKLNQYFTIADSLQIIDTSDEEHLPVAGFSNGKPQFSLPLEEIPAWFTRYLPNLYREIELFMQ